MRTHPETATRWAAIALRVALHDLRAHWATALMLVAGGTVTLAAALPFTALGTRLRIAAPDGDDLGLHWTMGMHPPAATQQQAVDVLSRMLLGTGCATLAVAVITLLILSLSREAEREDEIAMRRAVGASRAQVLLAAVFEGAILAGISVIVGGVLALAVGQVALGEWPGRVLPASIGRARSPRWLWRWRWSRASAIRLSCHAGALGR